MSHISPIKEFNYPIITTEHVIKKSIVIAILIIFSLSALGACCAGCYMVTQGGGAKVLFLQGIGLLAPLFGYISFRLIRSLREQCANKKRLKKYLGESFDAFFVFPFPTNKNIHFFSISFEDEKNKPFFFGVVYELNNKLSFFSSLEDIGKLEENLLYTEKASHIYVTRNKRLEILPEDVALEISSSSETH